MKNSRSNSATEGVGIHGTSLLFSEIGWGAIENPQRYDTGTDLFVAVRDESRIDLGMIVGAQVKCGGSYFKRRAKGPKESDFGWWYPDDIKHFDYWTKHQLPHLIVLYNNEEKIAYWQHIRKENCVDTGKGIKIFVPAKNKIDKDNIKRLIEVAATQRQPVYLEGTSFRASASNASPSDRLRYAFLASRLIAPHPNCAKIDELQPEEAIALIVARRTDQLNYLLKGCTIWKNTAEEPDSADLRWRLAFEMERFFQTHDLNMVRNSLSKSDLCQACPEIRTAYFAFFACACELMSKHQEVLDLLAGELSSNHFSPVDTAWLALHAAFCAEELFRQEEANNYLSMAISSISSAGADPTASLLRGTAYRALYNLSSMRTSVETESELARTLEASDNAISWWRDQEARRALDASQDEQFLEWGESSEHRFVSRPGRLQLYSSMMNCLLSADSPGFRSAANRLGRHEVVSDSSLIRSGLRCVILSGNQASFELIARKCLNNGPASAITEASGILSPRDFRKGTLRLALSFWSDFADAGSEHVAGNVAAWILSNLNSFNRLGIYPDLLLKALSGCLATTKPCATHEYAASNISKIAEQIRDKHVVLELTEALFETVPHLLDVDHLLESRDSIFGHCSHYYIAMAYRSGSSRAKKLLLDSAAKGNIRSACELYLKGELDAELTKIAVISLKKSLSKERNEAAAGTFGIGRDVDHLAFLIAFAIDSDEQELWQAVSDFLRDPNVIADHKFTGIRKIIDHASKLSPLARDEINESIIGIRESRFLSKNILDRRLPEISADFLARALNAALNGASESLILSYLMSRDQRVVALGWQLAKDSTSAIFDTIAVMSVQSDKSIFRILATNFIAKKLSRSNASESIRLATQEILRSDTVVSPQILLDKLSNSAIMANPWLKNEIAVAQGNCSRSVRRLAKKLANGVEGFPAAIPESGD